MRLFDRYLLSRVIIGTLFGILCLSAVMLLGRLFKDIKPLVVDQQAPLSQIATFLWSTVPFMLTFTLPWAFLSSIVLAFGKLSFSNELISMRLAGWSLYRIAAPIASLGLALSLLCVWLNGTVAPRAKSDIQTLLFEAVKKDLHSFLKPGIIQKQLGEENRVFVQAKKDEKLEGFHFYQLSPGQDYPTSYVYADSVGVDVSEGRNQLTLSLRNAYIESYDKEQKPTIITADQAQPWILQLPSERKRKKLGSMTSAEISAELEDEELDRSALLKRTKEIAKRQSMAFAPLVLGLIGIPLGIQSRRKETSSGFLIALLVAGSYFGMMMGFESIGQTPALRRFMIWLPNLVTLGLGVFLFQRANFR